MSEVNDEVPVEERFKRLARLAWNAAYGAVGSSFNNEEHAAKIKAAGSIAAALIESEARK